jgi:hypothetical protein
MEVSDSVEDQILYVLTCMERASVYDVCRELWSAAQQQLLLLFLPAPWPAPQLAPPSFVYAYACVERPSLRATFLIPSFLHRIFRT